MAAKSLYIVVAVAGIAAASAVAWWYQHRAAKPATESVAAAGAPTTGSATGGGGPARPPSVEVARVELTRLTDDAQAVGSLRSRQGVMLKPEVSGRVTKLNFGDGQKVRRGQLLVQLDDQLPQAQLQQAQAELSIANANHKRNQELVAQNFISQRSVDESSANLQVAQAKLALAQASLARLRILAPFDGVTGIRSVNVGDYLKDGADIVNLEDLEVVFVDFRLPERLQTKIQRGQAAMVEIDALPGRKYAALVQAIDPLVDANGRSIGIRGCIDNRKLELRPGMFARITAVFGERDNALVVPEEAIVPQGGRQYVIKLVEGPDQDTRIAQRVDVKVGIRKPGRVEIVEGLQAGDTVVTAGQQRIQKDGMPVRVMELSRPAGPPLAARANGGAVSGKDASKAAAGPSVARPAAATMAMAGTVVAGGNPCAAGRS